MNNYTIFTDSGCDISPEILAEWGVKYCSLTFHFDGEDKEYSNNDMTVDEFYEKMRSGGVAKTSAVNIGAFKDAFKIELDEGHDVLYLGFSGGLSTTCNSAIKAAEELGAEYPDRKVIAIDTLCGSAGVGLMVFLALRNKENGMSIEENAEFAEKTKLNISHWVTVDDLVYLKRGGRISPTAAFVGNMLGVKPIIYVDDNGKLISESKVRGRKRSIETLVNKYGELAQDTQCGDIFISHADNKNGAEETAALIKERYGAQVEMITDIGPVIGAHAGPGTIALFFVGKGRK